MLESPEGHLGIGAGILNVVSTGNGLLAFLEVTIRENEGFRQLTNAESKKHSLEQLQSVSMQNVVKKKTGEQHLTVMRSWVNCIGEKEEIWYKESNN